MNMIFKETKKKKLELKNPSEKVVHQQLADFLNIQYPDVIFCSDGSGIRATIGLRQEISRKTCKRYKVPDLIILEPRKTYCGLLIEIKKKGTKVIKANGEFLNEHIAEQAKTLGKLKEKGFAASFGIGYEECEAIIKDYLK